MPTKLKVGESAKMYCEDCSTEFELIHEPDYQDPAMAKAFGGKPKVVDYCPFCGDENVNKH